MIKRKHYYSILFAIVTIALIGYALLGFETYCWWNPTIDTQFSPGYDESKFSSIEPGMSEEYIIELLGEPFTKNVLEDEGAEDWYFSNDGKSEWGDWAWLVRVVRFDKNSKVIKTIESVRYD
ncbi:hypothetical protein [Desulfopila sp. IMCC35008]|uniref:hypothetical protein n=1 Tax=Desulfopila sp. IMCC35008 TaxID=2653858 RepID=UPI0013D58A31|nr:hypothetical protein [Desulfopila sp. IMCC35008]